MKCTCEGKPRIGYAETLMAKAMGMDLWEIHIMFDTFEVFLDKALDDEEGSKKYYDENGW